jgi:hypothetical protein
VHTQGVPSLPPEAHERVQRVLERVAARLLAQELNRLNLDTPGASAGVNDHPPDDGTDQFSTVVQVVDTGRIPVRRRVW